MPDVAKLTAVSELNMNVLEREILLLQLLQANNDVLLGSIDPAVLRHQSGASLLKLLIVENSLGGALDVDDVASLDELGGGGGGERRPVLEMLGLAAEVENGRGHFVKGTLSYGKQRMRKLKMDNGDLFYTGQGEIGHGLRDGLPGLIESLPLRENRARQAGRMGRDGKPQCPLEDWPHIIFVSVHF